MYQNFIIPYLYEAQHVSGGTPPIIRSLKLHWQPLVFIRRRLLDLQLVDVVRHGMCLTTSTNYTYKKPSTYEKPETTSAF
jgi:hypothetical protein